ncbi:Transmembrane and immunoglobulin domain-containing protein 1 [Bagarius yarrelli]|nr:Transmembrane and immunoglobulin domain-containing protein 1 [Bagarius yarrelli]
MRTFLKIHFIHLVLFCVSEVYGANVTIQSNPPTNGGWVQTHPDQMVSLTCSVIDSAAPEELQWFRNGQQVNLQDGNRVDTSHVCVQPVSRDDNTVTFTCQLKSNAEVKASIQLEVQYPPTLGDDETLLVEEKSDAVLSCDVWAQPPVSVVWKKDDKLLDLSSSNFKTSNNGYTAALQINNAKRGEHQGVYTCEADSSVYGVSRRNFRVTVVAPFPIMSSAIVSSMSGLGSTVSGMWRSHSVLPESEPESSPEAAQQFRKLRSSSSLNSLRMSLRKRLPLKAVQTVSNITENRTNEPFQNSKKTSTVTQMKRTAKNTIGNAYQKFQKSTLSREECLVRTPSRTAEEEEEENQHTPATARTPKRQAMTPRRTPRSATKRTPRAAGTPEPSGSAVRAVRTGGTRRQLVRMAALRSPFASPNTANHRRQFDQDLDSVSKGLRKLKRLSRAFDEVIGRDERITCLSFRPQKIQVLHYNGVKPKVTHYIIYRLKVDVFDVHESWKTTKSVCTTDPHTVQGSTDYRRRYIRTDAVDRYRTAMSQSYGFNPSDDMATSNPSSIRQQSRQIRSRVNSWTDGALSTLRKNI